MTHLMPFRLEQVILNCLKVLHFTLLANCTELINAYLNPTRAGRSDGVKERRVLPRHRVIFALASFPPSAAFIRGLVQPRSVRLLILSICQGSEIIHYPCLNLLPSLQVGKTDLWTENMVQWIYQIAESK